MILYLIYHQLLFDKLINKYKMLYNKLLKYMDKYKMNYIINKNK